MQPVNAYQYSINAYPYCEANQNIDLPDLSDRTIDTPQLIDAFEISNFLVRMKDITERWCIAPGNNREKKEFNTAQRMDLTQDTEDAAIYLELFYDAYKKNNKIISQVSNKILDGFKKFNCLSDDVAHFIARFTRPEAGKGSDRLEFTGAYEPLHRLFDIVSKMQKASLSDSEFMDIIFEPETLEPKGLAYINEYSLKYIKEMQDLFCINAPQNEELIIDDIHKGIFSHLGIKDLNAMQASSISRRNIVDEILKENTKKLSLSDLLNLKNCSPHNEQFVLNELISRLNTNEIKSKITLASLNITSVEELVAFFGDHCKKIEKLMFNDINPADLDVLAVHCVNLKHLILNGVNETQDINLKQKFYSLESLDLRVINDLKIFKNIIKSCSSITKLKCQYFEIDNFMALKKCHFLKEIAFENNIITLEGLNCCTSLEKVVLHECSGSGPLNIRVLGKCKNLNHLSIFNTEVLDMDFSLPSLISLYVYSDNFNDYSFLEGSPNFKKLIADELTNNEALKHCPSITNLQLVDFQSAVIPKIKECPLITKLLLKRNVNSYENDETMDIRELNASISLENLSIHDCYVEDFGVLFNHPSLKVLNIKNCENTHTAKILERKIKVFYE